MAPLECYGPQIQTPFRQNAGAENIIGGFVGGTENYPPNNSVVIPQHPLAQSLNYSMY
jgi:hypothetical protein